MKLDAKNIDYVKIDYTDRWNTNHVIKATLKSITDTDIKVCAKVDEEIRLNTPQEITLSIITGDGLYKTKATLKYVEYDDPFVFFIINKDIKFEFQQNREYFRIKYTNGAVIKYKENDIETRIVCKTKDISAKGVKLELSSRYNIPEEVDLKIFIDDQELNIKASLMRISVEDDILFASFQFMDIKEHDIDIISKFCIKKQLEDKRNKI